jgi:Carboxypeptidase regulatory-like domain/TonB dependent receptor
MLRTCIRHFLILLICVASVGTFAFGQTGTTSLRGTVTDKSGAAIVGAKVTLTDPATSVARETSTNGSGAYEFIAIHPGSYTLVIEAAGFRKHELSKLELLVNEPATENATLQVGATTETVEVSAQAATINTTDASLGIAFNERQVKDLPLEGRNVPDLLSLQPGVAYTGNRSDVPTWDTRSGAVNGTRSDQSNVTLDGAAVNDREGHAFTSVLPVTLDSVQEFRVTTSNYDADQGGSSGAQVSMVTKSGTNNFHGSAYEYNRNTATSANDYFVKASQLDNCEQAGIPLDKGVCNSAPKLIRNIFGGSLGGPIKKDRLFFFLNYEGTRRSEATAVTNVVPSQSLKDGVIFYQCDTSSPTLATDCPGGSVSGLSGKPYNIPTGYYALSPSQIAAMDPQGIGPNKASLAYLNTYPVSNSAAVGDGFNYVGYTWAAPISDDANVYIAKIDYNITQDAKHKIAVTAAMRNENNPGAPFLPGYAPSETLVNFNKGIIANYTGVLSNTIVNNVRYSFVRESLGNYGNSDLPWVYFRGLNDQIGPPAAVTRTETFQRPANLFADDLSWQHGKHSLQFGTQIAIIRTPDTSYQSSFSDGIANASWLDTAGFAGRESSPLNPTNSGYPGVDGNFSNAYDFPLQALMGIVSEIDAQYNRNKDGSTLPEGAPLKRRWGMNNYEFYGQDTWKVKPTLTLTMGLRWSLFSPPWETNGQQVSPNPGLGQLYSERALAGLNGIPSNLDPTIVFNLSGPANGKPNYYNWDYHNFAPRFAFAWAPNQTGGLLGDVFGEGKSSIRGGFAMVYDLIGQTLVDDFNQYGSFGLSTNIANGAGFQTVACAPRLTNINVIPTTDCGGNTVAPGPPPPFPAPFPPGNFAIAHGIDSQLKTPYAYTFDLSYSRQLKGGFTLQAAYVGRLARRLLMQIDPATPLDLKDKASGLDYFTATTALAKIYRQGVSTQNFNPSMVPANVAQYWADVISPLQPGDEYATSSCTGGATFATKSPVVAAYDNFCGNSLNETTGLLNFDYYGLSGINGNSYLPNGGQYTFYNPQYASLYMFKSMGTSNYNALQVTLQHSMSHGVQFDFNYTFSKSIDLASDATRVGTIGGNSAQVLNAWSPFQFRAVSDFDATHQINANWVAELPFGRGRAFAHDANGFVNALIGGWQFTGLGRWTSGFPFSVLNGYNWATNWELSGNVNQIAPVTTGVYHSPTDPSVVSAFATGANANTSFQEPFPGQAGQRNNLRGPGFFGLDMGLSKTWVMPWSEGQALQFRWEVFNVLNAVRFDPLSINATLDVSGSSFGQYTRLATNPRVMQFALRYSF